MKIVIAFIAFVAFAISHAHAGPTAQVRFNLERLKAAPNEGAKARADMERLAVETQRTIQIYVREADQNDWATPSPERLRRLGEVADAIEPFTSLLIGLGTPSDARQGSQNALNLLYFARPATELKQGLLELANVPKPRGAAHAAYDLIFNLGMGTGDVRQEILKRVSEYNEGSYKSNAATEVFYAAGAEWRLPEAVPFYVELLQRDSRSREELNTRVRAVANAVRPLGQEAAAVLPLLQQHFARMRVENVDPQTISVVEGAIRAVEGKEPIEPLLCVSGAGPVSEGGIRRGDSIPATASMPRAATATPGVVPAVSPTRTTPVAKIPAATGERNSPAWLWLVGIVALAVIFAFALKRRG